MPTEAKRATVAELREEVSRHRTLIVSEYRGLKVSELLEIRRTLRKQDVSYHVVKNRLMRIAAEGPAGEALSPLLKGPTAIAFGIDEAATAKAVLDATRPFSRIIKIKGGVLGNSRIDRRTGVVVEIQGRHGRQTTGASPARWRICRRARAGNTAPRGARGRDG